MENQGMEKSVSVGDWMLTMFLMAIPVVNLILLLVWAFGGGATPSKANWAKAVLLWMVISIGIGIVVGVIAGAAIFRAFRFS